MLYTLKNAVQMWTNPNAGLKMSFKNMQKPKWVKNVIQKYGQTQMLG